MNGADAPISVIMPTYNGRRFIVEALESIFRQRHPPAEIIVVDDGSTDGTEQVLGPSLGRIRYFPQPHRGSSAAWNWGLAQARGELIAFLDADDSYLPGHLEGLVRCLAANPAAGLVHSGWRYVRADGCFLGQAEPWLDAPLLDLRAWLIWKPARMGATLVERRWLERVGGFDETLRQASDVDLMLRLAWRGCRSVWCRQTTLCCRLHEENVTRQGAVQAEELDHVLDRFFSLPGLPRGVRRVERRIRHDTAVWAAWHLWRTGYHPQAVARLQAARALAGWSAQQSALRWMMRFHAWTEGLGKGVAASASQETRALLREAAGVSPREWDQVEAQYDCFSRIWWPSLRGEPAGPRAGEEGIGEGGRALSELSAPILLGAPRPVPARTVTAVWERLERGGRVSEAARHEVTRLYLAVLADSLGRRDARRAWEAFGSALAEGLSRVSLQAWRELLGTKPWRLLAPAAPLPRPALAFSVPLPPCERGLVSVIVAAYNQRPYVVQAVESVLAQDYPQREVIVVDDGSEDGTPGALAPRDRELTLVRQDNQGPAAARNHGLEIARGEFILFLDADDFLLPGTLRAHVEQLVSHRSQSFSHSGWRLVQAGGEGIADRTPWKDVPRLNLENWLLWKPVFLGSMMFRRSWLERSRGFDPRLRQAEDVELLLRLALLGARGEWIPSVTVCRRMHAASLTHDSLGQAQGLQTALLRFFREQQVPGRIRRVQKKAYYFTLMWISWHLIRSGNRDRAAAYLGQTQGLTRLVGRSLVLAWLNDLAERARGEPWAGQTAGELSALWPVFRRASKMDPAAWAQAERSLTFWLEVWQPYAGGRSAEGREGLRRFAGLTSRELVGEAQAAILASGQPVRPASLGELWQDALEAGAVASRDEAELMGLYLALAARALQQRWWGSLWHLAVPALKQLARPQGWRAGLEASVELAGELARRLRQWN